jgi:hypothetical protein
MVYFHLRLIEPRLRSVWKLHREMAFVRISHSGRSYSKASENVKVAGHALVAAENASGAAAGA